MALIEQVEVLRAKHADLELQLAEEVSRPHPSDEIIARMKREKLRLKDELATIQAHSGA